MTMTALTVLVYGVLVALGGIMGYAKAGSTASLAAGLVAGIVLVGAGMAMSRGFAQAGWWVSLVVATLLLLRFGSAAMKSFKMMPGGLMIIMSAVVIVVLLAGRGR